MSIIAAPSISIDHSNDHRLPDSRAADSSQRLPVLASGTGIDGIHYRDRLVSRQALAHWLGISPYRLGVWARNNYGPTPRRCGGYKLKYLVGEVLDFIHASSAAANPDVRRSNRKLSKILSSNSLKQD